MLTKEDIAALEDAKAALETSVRVSMLARSAIVARLEAAQKDLMPENDPTATFGAPAPEAAAEEACQHLQTKVIPSMGDTETSICYRCNVMLKDGVPQ